jgi:putative flippase GtrA
MALRKEILLFAISGVLGFIVDAAIVQFLVREWLVNP